VQSREPDDMMLYSLCTAEGIVYAADSRIAVPGKPAPLRPPRKVPRRAARTFLITLLVLTNWPTWQGSKAAVRRRV